MKEKTIQYFIISFAKKYGIKESIILTEFCRCTHTAGSDHISLSVQECSQIFVYMTEKQIRRSIKKLIEMECISIYEPAQKTFDRTLQYQINDEIYQSYLQALSSLQLF
jgi:hypothetical protein